jgi:hypothetical protein
VFGFLTHIVREIFPREKVFLLFQKKVLAVIVEVILLVQLPSD